MEDSFAYAKDKWEKSHTTTDVKVGDLVLVSPTNFNNIKVFRKLKYSFAGPFLIKALHGANTVEVELSEELSNKHPTFPVILIKPYKSSYYEKFPFKNKFPHTKKITKSLNERKLRTKMVREYLVSYSDPAFKDEWSAEKALPEATKILRRFRNTRNRIILQSMLLFLE
ncbi:hypothetical protein O181_053259 [Austropuccinia psidii MF-1]|uniref:Tf2-1-like SH3-like domain-containing protein n=1 Tax=Austropuccinia psidii MF-1 TaxID=1389203 RepID=A0A9Q3E2B5_9BASI|nr:hypothetical protein [Austropuccinia psidii MF-1]